jgi:sugar phosphate isomerase/epimerase
VPLPLAVSLAGLDRTPTHAWSASPRDAITWAAAAGFHAVQLDATALRARDLDRSARRDLAALLRRSELLFTGLDLWIPAPHFKDHAHQDRAVSAALGAIELAADLRSLAGASTSAVSLELPRDTDSLILRQLHSHAETRSVFLSDHTWPPDPRTLAADAPRTGGLALGLDPASVLLAGESPESSAARHGPRIGSARLSDVASSGRVPPGSPGARLDLQSYLVSLDVGGYSRPLILDLRGLSDQSAAADHTRRLIEDPKPM